MKYKHFDFLVEEMSDKDAESLLDVIILHVEEKRLYMGGGFQPASDEDYEPLKLIKGHVREIWRELVFGLELARREFWRGW